MAAMPYWMKHVRDSSLWIIFATYVPNTLLGLANAYGYGSLLGGGRGAGSSAPGYYSSWAYLLGGIFSLAHFPLTFRMRMVALNLQLANDREPTAKREVAIKEFLRTNLLRSLGSSLTSVVSFLVAATLWAAEGVQ
ncbi:hypothetical protein QBC33DRAFT_549821 [Phialemonium atrogriseum]|uniref:Uncharacterized protein n=1 Tax=Phialemonium atrogriseum TaxID=1093897 RepID=A0AAJ0FDP7_9PEZI|nr:uncharacterized protein QBC33DRAFT_549821 [Phialemonium atrogriseum]KAK1763482.1 hypothetical protein QBC33DRAFT_549821 [Phialemonium atrogriseum]